MNNIKSIDYKDWFISQKRIPDRLSEEYEEFFEFHKGLCMTGCYVGSVFITPWLYWHLNFWKTEVDFKDAGGYIQQSYTNPTLRDNEWLVANEIHRAETEHKGLVILGIRRFAKSVIASSYMSLGATFDENSQNVIAGLNADDIKLITDKMDKGLNILPQAWQWQRVEDNWKKQVTLGVKDKAGKRYPFSYVLIRNLDEGANEEAIAGTKPRRLLIDEIGKGAFLNAFNAAKPGFSTPFGWACSPILTGTGGDMKKFFDAKKLMFNPDGYNFLPYNNADDNKRIHGLFIGAKFRMECKVNSNLAEFLGKDEPELKDISIQVSDEEYALKYTDEEIEKIKKTGDNAAVLKETMYYPKKVDDIFLNSDENIFPVEACKAQQQRIYSGNYTGTPVELYHDGEKIRHKHSDKQVITQFPIKDQSKDAPIVIYEHPMEKPPFGLYVAGVDSYRQGQAKHSTSLGVVYIMKRLHSVTSEKFQDMIVASYAARPDNKDVWEDQARLLIKYYNAYTLVENDEISFIDYMKGKGDAPQYLSGQPSFFKVILPNSSQKREYGVSRQAEKVRNFLHATYKKYMEQIIHIERDNDGSIIKEVAGITKILDPMLLEETINYNEDGNFDRIIAFECALALANELDPMMKVSTLQNDPRLQSFFDKSKTRNKSKLLDPGPTTSSTKVYRKIKSKLFT